MLQKGEKLKNLIVSALGKPAPVSYDFDLNNNQRNLLTSKLRDAAVLVAIQNLNDFPRIILTIRAQNLNSHPGQVAFPGGKIDTNDNTTVDAALREAQEEIGLPQKQVEVLGCLSQHITISRFRVTPVVALVEKEFNVKPEKGEVHEVFSVPLNFLMASHNYSIYTRKHLGKNQSYYAIPYGPYYIWGTTARILRTFSKVLIQ